MYGHSPPCGAGVDRADVNFRRPLPVFRVVVLVGTLLPNSHHCGTVPLHTSCYCAVGKSSFSKADNPPPFKLQCNCGEYGKCEINGNGTKICRCNPGYIELNGHCEDCACGFKNTTCQMIEGTKFCACPSGYRDNRGSCEDINECELPGVCPSHTHCINTPGSFECACEDGYEPKSNTSSPKFDGCQDINECLDNKTCPFSDTLCVNLPGSYKCVCEEGYQPINLQGDPRYTRCRENNASWHHVNIALMVLILISLVSLLGVMLIRRRRSFLMSRNVNSYETL